MFIKLCNEGYKYRYLPDEWNDTNKEFLDDIVVSCGKNDWAAFQVLLKSDTKATVAVSKNPAFSMYGEYNNYRIEVVCDIDATIEVNLVGLIGDDNNVLTADLILKDDYTNITPNKACPIFVKIKTNENTESKTYSGKVNIYKNFMFEDEILEYQLDFTVDVINFTMHDPIDNKFHLDLWQHNSNIARKHDVSLYSDEHFKIIEEYVKSLANLGQKAITVVVSEIPWSGQNAYNVAEYHSDLYEYNMVKVTKDENGFNYDYSAMKRYIDMCLKHGINKEIEVIGLINIWVGQKVYVNHNTDYPDAVRIRYFDVLDNKFKYMKEKSQIKDYIKSLEEFFISNNYLDKVLIVADEPSDVEKYSAALNEIIDSAKSFKYKVAINHIEFIERFKDVISDIVPTVPFSGTKQEILANHYKTTGGRVLSYVCCGPLYPNTFLISPACESRIICSLMHFMELQGFLRWNYTVWPQNPRERISFRAPNWKAGDTNFVYPANNGRPLLTLRYYYLKRGIEDFEMLYLLEDMGKKDVCDRVKEMLLKISDYGDLDTTISKKRPEELYELDYSIYSEARKIMLEALAK